MRIVDRLGTFDAVVLAAPRHGATLTAIRALVGELHSDATEVASTKERSVWWGWGPGKMTDGYAYAMSHKDHVNLGFFRGSALPDPEGVLTGTGKALRHLKICDVAAVAHPAIRTLVTAARDERGRARGHINGGQ